MSMLKKILVLGVALLVNVMFIMFAIKMSSWFVDWWFSLSQESISWLRLMVTLVLPSLFVFSLGLRSFFRKRKSSRNHDVIKSV